MKVYYDYVRQELLTEQEEKGYIEQDVWEDIDAIGEFVINHYFYNEIIEKLPPDFIKEIVKTITERRLENKSLFCVREFPD